jgi:stress-induced morphogen
MTYIKSGELMSTHIEDEITQRITSAFPDALVRLHDLTGTRDHWEAIIVSEGFEGQRLIKRQQGVYKALGELMTGPVHAFTMQTLTPSEAEEKGVSLAPAEPSGLVELK